jgi:hypothetical protein
MTSARITIPALLCSAAVLGAPAAGARWRGYGSGYGYGPHYYGGWRHIPTASVINTPEQNAA